MSYTVFARKYRPRTFDEVIGQDHIVRTLKNAIVQERLAHAYIFVGPRGTGKTSTARILAKALNCSNGPRIDFDPEEPACKEIAEGRSMNVLEFDAASNTQVDKIREIIIDNVKYAPVGGKYKVYIVDEVHMLSPSSFNALLKTLEEPPPHVIFVFATTDVQKVPTTILSRCQRFDLKRIPTSLIRDHLQMIAGKENLQLSVAAAEAVARGAEGGMRDAESMLDQLVAFCGDSIEEADVLRVFGFTSQQTVSDLCAHLIAGDASAALRVVHDEAEAGRDLTRLLGDLIAHLRALLVAKADPQALAEELSTEAIEAVQQQAAQLDQLRLLELVERCAEAEQRMKWAPNKKMHVEIAVIRAIQTLNQATLGEILDTLTAMRGGGPLPEDATKLAAPARTAPSRSAPAPAARAAAVPAPTPAAVRPERIEPAPREVESFESKPASKPIAEEVPKPVEPSTPIISETPSIPVAEVWPAVIQRVRKERPLQAANVERAVLLEVKDSNALVAVDTKDALAFDMLEAPNMRKFLEGILADLVARPLSIKLVKRDGIAPTVAPVAAAVVVEAPKDPMAEFKNDALIRKALEIFKADIQPA